MRLYNIYYLCNDAHTKLKSLVPEKNADGSYTLRAWHICKKGLETLFDINFLREDVKETYNSISIFDTGGLNPR